MRRLLQAAAFAMVIGLCGKAANCGPNWVPDAPADNTGFANTAKITCVAHGEGSPGTAWEFYATSQKAGGLNAGSLASGNYSPAYPMPRPSSQGVSEIDPAAGSNGNHSSGSNAIKFWVKDNTTGSPITFALIGTRTVIITP